MSRARQSDHRLCALLGALSPNQLLLRVLKADCRQPHSRTHALALLTRSGPRTLDAARSAAASSFSCFCSLNAAVAAARRYACSSIAAATAPSAVSLNDTAACAAAKAMADAARETYQTLCGGSVEAMALLDAVDVQDRFDDEATVERAAQRVASIPPPDDDDER